jgi:hypothetical protein
VRLLDFIDQYSGVANVGDTPENVGECVGLIEAWLNEQGHPQNVWGNAKDLLANAGPEFEVIGNSEANYPLPGDILCFNGRWGGGYGHTGVVTSADPQTFTLFEQNNPTGSAPHLVQHSNYSNVQGWMRLKVNNQGDDPMPASKDTADETTVRLAYQMGLMREATPEDIAMRSGRQTEEALLRDVATSEEHGEVIRRFNEWPVLQTKVGDLTTQAQGQQKSIDGLTKQIETLQNARETLQTLPAIVLPSSTPPALPANPAAPSEPKTANIGHQLRDFFGTTQGRAVLGVAATIVTPIVMALQNFRTDNAVLAAAVLAAVTLLNTVKDALNPNVPNK